MHAIERNLSNETSELDTVPLSEVKYHLTALLSVCLGCTIVSLTLFRLTYVPRGVLEERVDNLKIIDVFFFQNYELNLQLIGSSPYEKAQ